MSTAALPRPPLGAWARVRRAWDRIGVYLPVLLMGALALGTYWLSSSTPSFIGGPDAQRPLTHDPDYFMREFSVKTFDATGRLKSEVFGTEARHYPDTDTLEIDNPRIRSWNEKGALTVSTGKHAISNGDGSEVQLIGDAVVVRESPADDDTPRMEIRSEFLHIFVNTEKVKTHKPVKLIRGGDEFDGDSLDYDNLDRIMGLTGRVRGRLVPTPKTTP